MPVSATQLLQTAVHELPHVPADAVFIVKDLFKGYEWKTYPVNVRLTLGTLFLEEIKSHPGYAVRPVNKTSSNQQKYQKLAAPLPAPDMDTD